MREAGGKHKWPLPEGVIGNAEFSEDGNYRYVLTRGWNPWPQPLAVFVGLNPSTAAADVDDPTVRKCWTWAREWEFNAFAMLNLYAFRATDPKSMRDAERVGVDVVGPRNNEFIARYAAAAGMIIAAWGQGSNERGAEVYALLERCGPVYCLGTNQDYSPKHPLYLAGDTRPRRWVTRSA